MTQLIFKEESYAIQGAIFEVYRQMGCGFLESVYQECLEYEFQDRGIPFQSQAELKLAYKGKPLQQKFKPGFICYGKIIVELKALSELRGDHSAQVLNYLKATGFQLGLLVNFGSHPKVSIERLVF